MAFSTLLTLFLLPIIIVWIFKRDMTPRRRSGERARARRIVARSAGSSGYRYAFIGAARCCSWSRRS